MDASGTVHTLGNADNLEQSNHISLPMMLDDLGTMGRMILRASGC